MGAAAFWTSRGWDVGWISLAAGGGVDLKGRRIGLAARFRVRDLAKWMWSGFERFAKLAHPGLDYHLGREVVGSAGCGRRPALGCMPRALCGHKQSLDASIW